MADKVTLKQRVEALEAWAETLPWKFRMSTRLAPEAGYVTEDENTNADA